MLPKPGNSETPRTAALLTVSMMLAAGPSLDGCTAAHTLEPKIGAPLQSDWEPAPTLPGTGRPALAEPWWASFNDPVLDRLLRAALVRNLDLRLAEARILEARAQRRAAGADQWPLLTATASDQFVHSPPPLTAAGAPRREILGGLNADWEVDLFGVARNRRRAAEAALRATQFDRNAVALNLLGDVATHYVEYRLAQSQYAIAARSAESQAETVRITRARFEQGAASRLDLERVESQLAITRSALPQSVEQAQSARNLLILLLAETPSGLAAVLPDTQPTTQNLPVADEVGVLLTPAEIIARRPDVRAAGQRLVAAAANLEAALAQRYPQLTLAALFGTAGSAVSQLMTAQSQTWSYGAGLTLPWLDFGRIRAGIDLADAEQLAAYTEYEQTVRGAIENTQSAIVQYAEGALRARGLLEALRSARNSARLARSQYREGALSLLEVLDAERSAYETEAVWAQSAAAVSQRLIALYVAMGVLPPESDALAR